MTTLLEKWLLEGKANVSDLIALKHEKIITAEELRGLLGLAPADHRVVVVQENERVIS